MNVDALELLQTNTMLIVNYHSESGNLTNCNHHRHTVVTAPHSGNCNRSIRSSSILNYEGTGRAGLKHVRGVRPNRAANFWTAAFWTLTFPINYVSNLDDFDI